jgi:hypothetical protein
MAPLKKIIFILLLAFTGLFIAGKIADKGYHYFWEPFFEKMDIIYRDSTRYDLLYLGSSNVNFEINPYYIDSLAKTHSYNIGYGGATIETWSMLFFSYLQQHPAPKAIVLSIDYSVFFQGEDASDPFLFFYYLQNSTANQYLKEKGYKTWLIKGLPFLKFSYFDDYNRTNIITGLFGESPFKKNATVYKGYISNTNDSVKFAQLENDINSPLDKSRITLLYQLLDYCRQNRIQVICLAPPRFYLSDAERNAHLNSASGLLLENVIAKYRLPYKWYDIIGLFPSNQFSDKFHLNKPGSIRYSVMLGHYIDSCLTTANH